MKQQRMLTLVFSLLLLVLSACGDVGHAAEATPLVPLPHLDTVSVEQVSVQVLQSYPVAVSVTARGELPDACALVDRVEQRREGDLLEIHLTLARQPDARCAPTPTLFETVFALDVAGLSAGRYTVRVDGVEDSFELETTEPTRVSDRDLVSDTENSSGTPLDAKLDIVLNPNIASGIQAQASRHTNNGMWQDWKPGFMVFTLEGYLVETRAEQARIFVYRVDDLAAESQHSADDLANLGQLLQGQPDLGAYPKAGVDAPSGYVPWVRAINATPMMHAGVAYLDFQNGAGMRYLTQYAQGLSVVNNEELMYTFQGLTEDGDYYIAAVLPVQHPYLLVGAQDAPDGDASVWTDVDTNREYVGRMAHMLDQAEPSSFTPNLSALDAMMHSISIR
jgi:hypothetical protein